MPTAFEDYVNTELPKRLAIATAVLNNYTRFTGTGKQVEARTPAQVLADISGAKITVGSGNPNGIVSGSEGDFFWDDVGDELWANNDSLTAWTKVGPSTGGGGGHGRIFVDFGDDVGGRLVTV
jgi:hypothetical protein